MSVRTSGIGKFLLLDVPEPAEAELSLEPLELAEELADAELSALKAENEKLRQQADTLSAAATKVVALKKSFDEQQRKSARPLWLACGDCLWDGIPTLGDGNKWHLRPALNHKLFTKAYFVFGDAGKTVPGGCHAQWFLLLPNKFSRRLLETTPLVNKTVELLGAAASGKPGGGKAAKKS